MRTLNVQVVLTVVPVVLLPLLPLLLQVINRRRFRSKRNLLIQISWRLNWAILRKILIRTAVSMEQKDTMALVKATRKDIQR